MLFSEIEPQRSTLDRIEVGKTIKDCKCENQIKLLHRFSLEESYCFLLFFLGDPDIFTYFMRMWMMSNLFISFIVIGLASSGCPGMEKVYLGSIDG